MISIFYLLIALYSMSFSAQTNLIKDGSFETDLLNWRGEDVATISLYDKKAGKNSCTINQYVEPNGKELIKL